MKEIFIQAIPSDAIGLVIYFEDEQQYEHCKKFIYDLESKINKPILGCLNKSLKVLNQDELKSYGLQKISMEGSSNEN
jgi:hypothetical protein